MFSYYMFKHFERRREERNEASHEKKQEAYYDLLDVLRKKNTDNDNKKTENI